MQIFLFILIGVLVSIVIFLFCKWRFAEGVSDYLAEKYNSFKLEYVSINEKYVALIDHSFVKQREHEKLLTHAAKQNADFTNVVRQLTAYENMFSKMRNEIFTASGDYLSTKFFLDATARDFGFDYDSESEKYILTDKYDRYNSTLHQQSR